MDYSKLERAGKKMLHYGLAIVLVWIGLLKFTSYEAEGIQPLAAHSPFLSWMYHFMSVQEFAVMLGIIEISSGILIACRVFSPRLAVAGGFIGIVTFITTLTLLLSTPGIIQPGYTFPFISPMPGQFVLKDIVLLGAATYTTGEAWRAIHKTYTPSTSVQII